MGTKGRDKIYCIQLTIYNVFVNQVNLRSNYSKFKGIISDNYNNFLFYTAVSSIVSGPLIGYFDRYSDVHTHSFVVAIFVISEILYVLNCIYITNNNRDYFKGKE